MMKGIDIRVNSYINDSSSNDSVIADNETISFDISSSSNSNSSDTINSLDTITFNFNFNNNGNGNGNGDVGGIFTFIQGEWYSALNDYITNDYMTINVKTQTQHSSSSSSSSSASYSGHTSFKLKKHYHNDASTFASTGSRYSHALFKVLLSPFSIYSH